MKRKTLCILSAALLCSFLPWTGRSASAESLSAAVLVEAPDEGEAQEMQEKIPGKEEIRELQDEVPGEEEIQELQEGAPDEGEIQELQEEVPDVKEEKAGISDNDLPVADRIPIDEAHFPDSNFRKYLTVSSFDKNNDGILSEQEIKNVTSIDCRKNDSDQGSQGWGEIESLEGIGYFTEITFLNCEDNGLTSLDVSQNKKLRHLACGGNDLTSLNVSQNKELAILSCSHNDLGALVIGQTTKLTHLSCDENQLEELDLTGVSQLQQLDCSKNKLTDLQIGRHKKGMIDMHCEDNLLTHLDLSMIEWMGELYCSDNKLSSLILSDNLESVECQNNLLTELDLSNDPFLRYMDCSGNMLRSLDLSRNFLGKNDPNDTLAILICNDNRLEEIKFTKDTDLRSLSCENNRLRSLDVKDLQELRVLRCLGNDISTLDVRRTPALFYLRSDPGTKVVYADAPKLTSLKRDQKEAELTWEYKGVTCDGFFIYRREGKDDWKRVGEIRKASGKGRYSYTDRYTGKESVTYTVRAFRSMRPGADEDTYTDRQGAYDKKGLSAPGVPSAPKSVRATSRYGKATLTWKKVSGASGYHVYRKASKKAKWKKIADVKPGKTSYIDKRVESGGTYSYRVRAYKKGTGKNKNVIANGVYSAIKKAKIR